MNPETHIQTLLESCPAARDDENLLISSVWSRELEFKHVNMHKMHVYLFMGMLMEGQLISASEILRISYYIQKQRPELRGENWEEVVRWNTIEDVPEDDY